MTVSQSHFVLENRRLRKENMKLRLENAEARKRITELGAIQGATRSVIAEAIERACEALSIPQASVIGRRRDPSFSADLRAFVRLALSMSREQGATISEFATCAGLTREFVHKVLREDKNGRRTMFEELNKDRQETMF